MNEITIICCWNNEQQYRNLLASISKQEIKVDVIGIDNRNQVYKSCSKAFNDIINQVKTKYVLFSHQDIIFLHSKNLTEILEYLNRICQNDILGFAGASFDSEFVKTNVFIGNLNENEYGGTNRVRGIEKCNTLDECLFGGYSQFFQYNRFDESICYAWHLYAVEFCLRTMVNGGNVYVCDVELNHTSRGKVNFAYNRIYREICKKYRNDYKYLRTPCCYYSGTSFFKRNAYYMKKNLGLVFRKIGIRK